MRLTDDDILNWGPITIGRLRGRPLHLVLSSGGGTCSPSRNSLAIYAFGWAARLWLPTLLKPHTDERKSDATGENYITAARAFGFALEDGFLQVFHGRQTFDSSTEQVWCKHLPWTQWRHVRTSYYDLEGKHFWTEPKHTGRRDWEEWHRQREACPAARFEFDDYDGKRIVATTRIEEREWHFGEGWFKWLSWFRKPMVRRSLDIAFSAEVGPDKGSWKGGMIGHSIDMLPGELHEAAFRRYCEKKREARGRRKYRIHYIGPIAEEAVDA